MEQEEEGGTLAAGAVHVVRRGLGSGPQLTAGKALDGGSTGQLNNDPSVTVPSVMAVAILQVLTKCPATILKLFILKYF